MRTERCDLCGVHLTGRNLDEITAVGLAHYTEVHPELGLTETSMRNYYEAIDRLTGPIERLSQIGDVEIREAEPGLIGDVLSFFDHDAFCGRPEWAACYCVHHHRPIGTTNTTWQENREELANRLRQGMTQGVLAYIDGRLGGWCNASTRSEFPELVGRDELPDGEVGSVWCFVIAPPYRRHGLAGRLLDGALKSFEDRGLSVAEAYPRRSLDASPDWADAVAFHGPLDLFLRAGFKPVADEEHRVVVQKRLERPS